MFSILAFFTFFIHIGAQDSLIILPNSSVHLNCSLLDSSCLHPSWKIGGEFFSYYSLSNSLVHDHFVDADDLLIIDNIGSENNETKIMCVSLELNNQTNSFSVINGPETKLIVAAIPDRPERPDIMLSIGCTVIIQWNSPFDNHKPIKYYIISLVNDISSSFFNVSSMNTNYAISHLTGGFMYYVSIAAGNEVGIGMYSMTSNFEFPKQAPVPICDVISTNLNSIILSWNLPANSISDETLYNVTFVINYSGGSEEGLEITTDSTVSLQSLIQNTQYIINVTSIVPDFINCIQNSTCTLFVTTLANSAFGKNIDFLSLIITFLLYMLLSF